MGQLALSNGGASLVDDDDHAELARWRWLRLGGYAVRKVRNQAGGEILIYLHRQLLRARPYEVVDHINNDRLDNRRSNLRVCSQSENMANRASPRPNMYRGVYYERRGGRWRAQISINGRNRYLGTFATPELAALAYDRAAEQAWGRFARLNLPDHPEAMQQMALEDLIDPFAAIPLPKSFHSRPMDRLEWAYLQASRRAPLPPINLGNTDDLDIPY